MNEFLELLKHFDLKGIFLTPTKNEFLQFFRYLFVGGIATIGDWGSLFLLTSGLGVYHLISAVISFIIGLLINFMLSKAFVFKANEAKVNAAMELFGYALIGMIGLAITEIIMYLLTNRMNIYYMISKILATVVVLVWNYLARKHILYK